MDPIQYEQYRSALESGQLSVDALKRIIKHDQSHGWMYNSGCLARLKVLDECEKFKIPYKKYLDKKGDALYGVRYPLPLTFEQNKKLDNV
jgi:hypothetical protein